MVDLSTVKSTAQADLNKVQTEIGFVRANWGKLSIVIILAAAAGLVVGHIL